MSDIPALTRAERLALVEDLERLDAGQWATPSLCPAWTVQQVAAHLAGATAMGPGAMLVGMARAGFRINRFIADSAVAYARRGPEAVIAQLRTNAERGAKPMGMPDAAALCDAVVHGLDIRVPLGLPHAIPDEAVRRVAGFMVASGARFPASVLLGRVDRRVDGVRLEVTDPQWSHGDGPVVRTDAVTALLLLAGRPYERDALTGEGADVVRART